MRFFTPELYVRFNSSDEEEADRANEAWEKALVDYRKHLDSIQDRVPSQVRKLADLCLHDAELLACEQPVEPLPSFQVEPFGHPFWFAMAILSLRQDGQIVSLIYMLWDRIREYPPPENWPFSKLRTHWLYDEVDLTTTQRGGQFLHRILLSDGRVLEVPFVSAIRHSLPLSEVGGTGHNGQAND